MNESMVVAERQVETLPERAGAFAGGLLSEESVAELEKQVALVKRQRLALVKLTEADHWRDFDGKPYLEDGGIQVVASTLGVQFGVPEATFEDTMDEQGDVITCRCAMTATLHGRISSDVGSATSRDPIYKGKSLAVVRNEVEKKAITNSQHRCLSKLTGLGGVTWSLLEQLGYRRGAGGTTRFKGQEQKQATGAGEWTPAKEKLWGCLCELAGGEEAAAEMLFKRTHDPDRGFKGIRDPAALSHRQVAYFLPAIEAEWRKSFGKETNGKAKAPSEAQGEPGERG